LHTYAITENMILAVVLGTLICGTGLAITFAINASTGGTDILAKIINKYSTVNIGKCLLLVDLFVVVCGGLTFGLDKGLYSLMAVVINGLLIDSIIAKIEKRRDSKQEELKLQNAQ
ncbi:YitT family protein, partial [Clostridium tertium]